MRTSETTLEDFAKVIGSTQFVLVGDNGIILGNRKLEDVRRTLETKAEEYKQVNPGQLGPKSTDKLLLEDGLKTYSFLGDLYTLIANSEDVNDSINPAALEQPKGRAEVYRKKAVTAYNRAIEFARELGKNVIPLILKREGLSEHKNYSSKESGERVINQIVMH